MDRITDLCTGCRACEQVCAKHAISMVADKEGFLAATINADLCVDCGLCQKRCPQNNLIEKSSAKKVLAVRLKDDQTLYKSASGGAFAGIAKAWIAEGGVVVGVVYDNDWNAHHISATTDGQLDAVLSSKYVQADTRATYKEVKQLLEEGKRVLYSGTGCQIGGLKAFLRKDYDNLLTMDLICHGVPSPLLFKKYIGWLQSKKSDSVTGFDFRSKKGGWALNHEVRTVKGSRAYYCDADPYYYRFLDGSTYRECCYHCNYCTPERAGDITIGDYWGIEKEHPQFFNTKGVSCVLINTDKGLAVWEKYGNLYHTIESTFEQVARHNGNLLHPTKRVDAIRDHIYDGINDTPDWFDKVFAASFKPTLKAKIKNLMPMWVRLLAKK